MTETPITLVDGAVALGGRPVLRGIDLRVEEGEFVALLGPNGSGKSTLVRSVVGLRPLARGRLDLFGTPVERFTAWRRVGYVPQRSGAGSGVPASVREVVSSGRLTRRRLLRPATRADRRAVDDAIALVGLADRARDGVTQLSGGQQQRVLIARAMAGEPDLFVLDEPTAGVDLAQQQVLADTLGTLKDRGVTVVLVAHELGPLATLVDRAVVLRDGRIEYDGPVVPAEHVGGHDHPAHHVTPPRHDHAPHIASPIEPR
jgi:zinc transport system ATP-binding protein